MPMAPKNNINEYCRSIGKKMEIWYLKSTISLTHNVTAMIINFYKVF